MTYKANHSGNVDTHFQRKGVVWPIPLKKAGSMMGLNSSSHNVKTNLTSFIRQSKHIDDLIMFLKN